MDFPPTPALGGNHREGQNFFADMSGDASFVNGAENQSLIEGGDTSLIGLGGGNMFQQESAQQDMSLIGLDGGGDMMGNIDGGIQPQILNQDQLMETSYIDGNAANMSLLNQSNWADQQEIINEQNQGNGFDPVTNTSFIDPNDSL